MGYLVISRKIGERIVIGDVEIEILLCDVKGHRAEIAIKAPPNVRIERKPRHIDERNSDNGTDPRNQPG